MTLLDFLKIYLDYGYIDKIKKEIEIDENKYGLKFIDLLNEINYDNVNLKYNYNY